MLALDVRGRGHSAARPRPDNYNPQVYAGDVVKLMHELGIARAVFVGTSMGGLITMALAATPHRPGRRRGPQRHRPGDLGKRPGAHRRLRRQDACAWRRWEEAAGYVRDINACAFPDNPDAEWDKWARRAFDAGRRRAAWCRATIRTLPLPCKPVNSGRPRSPARMAFRRLTRKRPTLLVRGALSDLLEARQAEWMRRAAPTMQYVEVPDVGHAPMLTEPAALEAIAGFLATVP